MSPAHVAVAVLALAISQASSTDIEVAITEGSSRAAVIASAQPNVTGAPHASIPARPLKTNARATCEWFRIRAWVEGDGVSVIVFAVNRPPEGDQESQLATYLLKAGDSVEVTETTRYGARPVRLEVTARASSTTATAPLLAASENTRTAGVAITPPPLLPFRNSSKASDTALRMR